MPGPNENYEIANQEIQALLKDLGNRLGAAMPEGWGFTLMLYDYAEHEDPEKGSMFYISSARRRDMVKAMREFIAKEGHGA